MTRINLHPTRGKTAHENRFAHRVAQFARKHAAKSRRTRTPAAPAQAEPQTRISSERRALLKPILDCVSDLYVASQEAAAVAAADTLLQNIVGRVPVLRELENKIADGDANAVQQFQKALSSILAVEKNRNSVRSAFPEVLSRHARETPSEPVARDALNEQVKQSFSYRARRYYDYLRTDPLAFRGMVDGLGAVAVGSGALLARSLLETVAATYKLNASEVATVAAATFGAGLGLLGIGGIITIYSARHFRGEQNLREREADVDMIVRAFTGCSLSEVGNQSRRLALLFAAESVLRTLVDESEKGEDKSLSTAFDALLRNRTPENVGAFKEALSRDAAKRGEADLAEAEARERGEVPLQRNTLSLSEIGNMFNHDLREELKAQASRRAEFVRAVRITTGLSIIGLSAGALLAGVVSPLVGWALVAGGLALSVLSRSNVERTLKTAASFCRTHELGLRSAGGALLGAGLAVGSVLTWNSGIVSNMWNTAGVAGGALLVYHFITNFLEKREGIKGIRMAELTLPGRELAPILQIGVENKIFDPKNKVQVKRAEMVADNILRRLVNSDPQLGKAYVKRVKDPERFEIFQRMLSRVVSDEHVQARIVEEFKSEFAKLDQVGAKANAAKSAVHLHDALKDFALGYDVTLNSNEAARLASNLFRAVNGFTLASARKNAGGQQELEGLKKVEAFIEDEDNENALREAVQQIVDSRIRKRVPRRV